MRHTIENPLARQARVFSMFYPPIDRSQAGDSLTAQHLLASISTSQGKVELASNPLLQRQVEQLLLPRMGQVKFKVSCELLKLGMSDRSERFAVVLKDAASEIFQYIVSYFGDVRLESMGFPLDFVTMMYMVSNLIGSDYDHYFDFVKKILLKELAEELGEDATEVDLSIAIDVILANATEQVIEQCTDLSTQELNILNEARFVGHRGPETLPQLQIKKRLTNGKAKVRVGYCELWETVLEGLKKLTPDNKVRKSIEKILMTSTHRYLSQAITRKAAPHVISAFLAETKNVDVQTVEVGAAQGNRTVGQMLVSMIAVEASETLYANNKENILQYCRSQNFDIQASLVQQMMIDLLKSTTGSLSSTEIERQVSMHTIFIVCNLRKNSLFKKFWSVDEDLLEHALMDTVVKFADIKSKLNEHSKIQDSTRQSMEEVNWPHFVEALNTGLLDKTLFGFIKTTFIHRTYDSIRRRNALREKSFSDLSGFDSSSDGYYELISNVLVDPAQSPAQQVEMDEVIQKVAHFIQKLSIKDKKLGESREALLIMKGQEFSLEEMSSVLGIEIGTVKSRASRTMMALFELIRQFDPELFEELMEFKQFSAVATSAEYLKKKKK